MPTTTNDTVCDQPRSSGLTTAGTSSGTAAAPSGRTSVSGIGGRAMATGPLGEARRPGAGLTAGDDLQPEACLVGHRVDVPHVPLLVAAQSVVAHATLWQPGELVGQCQRLVERRARVDQPVG